MREFVTLLAVSYTRLLYLGVYMPFPLPTISISGRLHAVYITRAFSLPESLCTYLPNFAVLKIFKNPWIQTQITPKLIDCSVQGLLSQNSQKFICIFLGNPTDRQTQRQANKLMHKINLFGGGMNA